MYIPVTHVQLSMEMCMFMVRVS